MVDARTLSRTGLALALAVSLAACTQQPSPRPPQQTGTMAGMRTHQGRYMSSMNMQQIMAHCAEMRQQMRPSVTMSPDIQAMMAHCDQMHPQVGTAGTTPGGAALRVPAESSR